MTATPPAATLTAATRTPATLEELLRSHFTPEQRASPRFLTFRTGRIVSLQDDKEILAVVLDISTGGACLLVSDIHDIPDSFQFFADCGAESYCCEVRWKAGHKVGIRFDART